MQNLRLKTRIFKSTGSKFIMGFIIASTLSMLPMSSAFADRDDWGEHDRGGRGGDRDGWRGGEHERWEHRREYGNGYGGYPQPAYVQPYGYGYAPQPIYVPPPVQYLPPQSPGINLILPLNFR
ncbi:hypothetical protein [Methylomonas sp. AM2-LC]|uniref:hypothetical protein n=1 Tax=Methylomonas sp. AM2-LC TaxID=3153301 RepID=UPI0032661CAA